MLEAVAVGPLTLELLAWVAGRPRTYEEAMEAWRSTCPRHPVWEDALAGGLIQVVRGSGTVRQSRVTLTARGSAVLAGAEAGAGAEAPPAAAVPP